ncbi:benzoylformate decarboxylase [Promicromonospora sp. Populi]|uniref:benzoylformate decarboxylase n=1 Tax=Promicromonospora sp. Populi TaxID=3239420 RepID=UPI0034E220E7
MNLHAAAGTGNAMGALTNAVVAHSPLVITAGQQVRDQVGAEVMLANVGAPELARPLVKWSAEPLAARDVPRSISQAAHLAALAPAGPVYVSVPYDDWAQDAGAAAAHLAARHTSTAGGLPPETLAELVAALDTARSPVLVLGPDVDTAQVRAGAEIGVVQLAERLSAPVWIAPSASRCPFPTRHPAFRGVLPASIAGIARAVAGHDLVVVIGAPVFRYHQYEPGDYLPEGTRLLHITCDPGEAARAPMGDAIVADIGQAVRALSDAVAPAARPAPDPRDLPPVPDDDGSGRLDPATVLAAVAQGAPHDAIFVKESTSTTAMVFDHLDLTLPGSYYFPAAGGLGFGLPAAVGVQLAQPGRRVVALVGDGSANYGITALWTAAQHRVPVVFVILNNGTYAALRSFVNHMGVSGTPGIDIPGIDFVALAQGYGVSARRVSDVGQLREALAEALASEAPTLIEVPTTPTDPLAP